MEPDKALNPIRVSFFRAQAVMLYTQSTQAACACRNICYFLSSCILCYGVLEIYYATYHSCVWVHFWKEGVTIKVMS